MDNNDNKLALLIRTGWFLLSPSSAKFTSSTCSIISPNSCASISVAVAGINGGRDEFLLLLGGGAGGGKSLFSGTTLVFLGFRKPPPAPPSVSESSSKETWEEESKPYGSKSKAAEAEDSWDEKGMPYKWWCS